MNTQTERRQLSLARGELEVAIDRPEASAHPTPSGVAVVCHPHPLFDGTMDNKVVQTLTRAHVQAGWTTWRFNFRGVGRSSGQWDEGRGEIDDAEDVLNAAVADAATRGYATVNLALSGFSFGGYVASQLAGRIQNRMNAAQPLTSVCLVAPAVVNFDVLAPPVGSLVVHGSADEVVPLDAVLRWAGQRAPSLQPVLVLPGVGHFFHGQLALLKQAIVQHLLATGRS